MEPDEPQPSCSYCGLPLRAATCHACGWGSAPVPLADGDPTTLLGGPILGLHARSAWERHDYAEYANHALQTEGAEAIRLQQSSEGPGVVGVLRGVAVLASIRESAELLVVEAPVARLPATQVVPAMRILLERSGRDEIASRFALRGDLVLVRGTVRLGDKSPVDLGAMIRAVVDHAREAGERLVALTSARAIEPAEQEQLDFEALPPASVLEIARPGARDREQAPGPANQRPEQRTTRPVRAVQRDLEAMGLSPLASDLPPGPPLALNAMPTPPPQPEERASLGGELDLDEPGAPSQFAPLGADRPVTQSGLGFDELDEPPPLTPLRSPTGPKPEPKAAPPKPATPSLDLPPLPKARGLALGPPPSTQARAEPAEPEPAPRAPSVPPAPEPEPRPMEKATRPALRQLTPEARPSAPPEPPGPAGLCQLLHKAQTLGALLSFADQPATMLLLVRATVYRAIYQHGEHAPGAVGTLFEGTRSLMKEIHITAPGKRGASMQIPSASPAFDVMEAIAAQRGEMPDKGAPSVQPITTAQDAKQHLARYVAEVDQAPSDLDLRHFLALGALCELVVRTKLPDKTLDRLRQIIARAASSGATQQNIELMMSALNRIIGG